MAVETGFRIASFGSTLAPRKQNGFNGLGDTVATYLVRTKACDQAHQEAADHRHRNDPPAQMSVAGGGRRGTQPVEEEEVGKKVNELEQNYGDIG